MAGVVLLNMSLTPHTRFNVAKEKLWKDMPFRERRVLMAVLTQGSESLFKVSDLINLSALGSQATIHASLTSLIKSGHLKYSFISGFRHSKFISLTKTSSTLFSKLDTLFIACATAR